MIEAIEELLLHWGEQCERHGLGGGGASPLAGLIEWQGAPPRGEPSSVILLGGSSIDHAASEVAAVLAALEVVAAQKDAEAGNACGLRSLQGSPEGLLVRLAHARYRARAALPVADQVRGLGLSSRDAYFRRLHELHERVQAGLLQRVAARAA